MLWPVNFFRTCELVHGTNILTQKLKFLIQKLDMNVKSPKKRVLRKLRLEFFREKITFYFMEVSVRFEKGFFQLRAVYQNSNSAPHLLQCLWDNGYRNSSFVWNFKLKLPSFVVSYIFVKVDVSKQFTIPFQSKQLGSTTAYMLVYTSQSNIDKLHSGSRFNNNLKAQSSFFNVPFFYSW